MLQATLTRETTGDTGTFGRLDLYRDGVKVFECQTAELPWRDNRRNVSCIKPGRYICEMRGSSFGRVYELKRVEGRSNVLIHYGNWAGDESLGYVSDVEGCILVGQVRTDIEYRDEETGRSGIQLGVTSSRKTLNRFHLATLGECLVLDVVEDFSRPDA